MKRILICTLMFGLTAAMLVAEDFEPFAPKTAGEIGSKELDSLEFDWLRLTNGEWLKGDFITLRDEDLTFDSDEFGEYTLEMKDIHELYTRNSVTVVLQDQDVRESRVAIVGSTVVLVDIQETMSRNRVLSIVPDESSWWALWEGDMSFGLSAQYGNTRQTDLQLRAGMVNRGAFHRYTLSYIGSISLVDSAQTSNSHTASGIWDMFVVDRFYISPLGYRFYSNPFQNIAQEHTPAAGFGFEAVASRYFDLDITGGAGYQLTVYESVLAGEDKLTHSGIIIVGLIIGIDPTKDIEMDLDYNLQIDVVDWPNNFHSTVFNFEIDLTGSLDFNIGVVWNYRNAPKPREDGSIPLKHDVNLSTGIGFEF